MQGIKSVTNSKNTWLYTMLIIIIISACKSIHSKEVKTYILFNNNVDGMFKMKLSNSDSSFLYQLQPDRAFWCGFSPLDNGKIYSKQKFLTKYEDIIRDESWLRIVYMSYPDSLMGDSNIYIIEDLGETARVIPCSFFTMIE